MATGGMLVGGAKLGLVRVCVWILLVLLSGAASAEWPPLEPLDERRLERFGLRLVQSNHAQLVTDLPVSEAIDSLPRVVDLATPQWAQRFGIDEPTVARWKVRLCLIGEESRFVAAGLMPEGDRRFPNGLSLGYRTWIREQPTDYYRTHLVLHEVTHAFMQTLLGGCGPGWYMEGMAELCGTHRLADPLQGDNALQLAVIPPDRNSAPMWGRVRAIRDAVAGGRGRSIDAVRSLDNSRPMSPEEYSWVWALAKLLDTHPRYQERFRALSGSVLAEDFDRRFDAAFSADRERLEQEWRLFLGSLRYGHDIRREAIDFRDGRPLRDEQTATVQADRGWQSSGLRLEAGQIYTLTATGRYTIARDSDGAPWPCEPNGVTLDYHNGRPLGELLATTDAGADAFLQATPIGLQAAYRPKRSGTLYLRSNDRPNELSENSGTLSVVIRSE